MPYIKTAVNMPVSPVAREAIKTQLGKDAAIIGKGEGWLMVDFRENCPLYFKGTDEPAAIVSVELYGAAGGAAYDQMTAAITKLISGELGIDADRIYVKYEEFSHWGWNGRNF